AALVAHLVNADVLVMLTDTPGLLTADPRLDEDASLIEEIVEVDHELERVAGASGSVHGSGGMASKLAAAKMAAWSGVRTVLADPSGKVFAKGLVRYAANVLKDVAGSKTSELPDGLPHEVVHRDDLVVLP